MLEVDTQHLRHQRIDFDPVPSTNPPPSLGLPISPVPPLPLSTLIYFSIFHLSPLFSSDLSGIPLLSSSLPSHLSPEFPPFLPFLVT
jgi:hypothetical protein